MTPDHVSRGAINLQTAPLPEITGGFDPRSLRGPSPRPTLLRSNHLQNPERLGERKGFTTQQIVKETRAGTHILARRLHTSHRLLISPLSLLHW